MQYAQFPYCLSDCFMRRIRLFVHSIRWHCSNCLEIIQLLNQIHLKLACRIHSSRNATMVMQSMALSLQKQWHYKTENSLSDRAILPFSAEKLTNVHWACEAERRTIKCENCDNKYCGNIYHSKSILDDSEREREGLSEKWEWWQWRRICLYRPSCVIFIRYAFCL